MSRRDTAQELLGQKVSLTELVTHGVSVESLVTKVDYLNTLMDQEVFKDELVGHGGLLCTCGSTQLSFIGELLIKKVL